MLIAHLVRRKPLPVRPRPTAQPLSFYRAWWLIVNIIMNIFMNITVEIKARLLAGVAERSITENGFTAKDAKDAEEEKTKKFKKER
jgi:hypothetical protein